MQKKIVLGLSSLVALKSFTTFSEYFLSVIILYALIALSLIVYGVRLLIMQKSVAHCFGLALLMSLYLILNDDLITLEFTSFHSSILSDYLSFFSKSSLCFFSAVYFFIIADSLKEQKLIFFEYQLVILLSILGLMLMCSCNDLITAFLAIELSSLAFYLLASYRKTSLYSIEGGVKYFITGAISSAFFLLGSSILYGSVGSVSFYDFALLYDLQEEGMFDESFSILQSEIIHETMEYTNRISSITNSYYKYYRSETSSDPECLMMERMLFESLNYLEKLAEFDFIIGMEVIKSLMKELFEEKYLYQQRFFQVEFCFSIILFSLFIKLATFPFHLWSLDVYESSPTSSTFFFAVITKLIIFVFLMRLYYWVFYSFHGLGFFYFLFIGILSIFVGSFGGLKQRSLKTLLAYSSITHIGYSLIALGGGTFSGGKIVLFYLIIYTLSGLSIWAILLSLRLRKKDKSKYSKEIGDLTLLRKANPSMAFAFALTMFSIAGIPPLAGFFAKMSIFFEVVNATNYVIAFLSLLFSVVSTFYYIRLIKILYFENLEVGKLYYPANTSSAVILSGLIFLLVFFFYNPNLLYAFSVRVFLSDIENLIFFGDEIVQLG